METTTDNGWRYLAYRLNGDGTETPLNPNVPLTDVTFTKDLSGPSGMDATLKPEYAGMTASDGSPLFVTWGTAIYAEKDGEIRRGYILYDVDDDGPELGLAFVGWAGYPKDQPFHSEYTGIAADPLDIVRLLWKHLQDKPGGNTGLVLDDTKSTIRVGKALPAGTTTSQEEGPFVLGWWETKDIGGIIDQLAADTPFDYREEHEWDGEKVAHRLRIGFPTIGQRRTDLRFVVGENLQVNPAIQYRGEEYATAIILLGAGEGRLMCRGLSVDEGPPAGRLRRVLTLEDKSLTDNVTADRAATRERNRRRGDPDFTSLIVNDHPNAPLGSYDVGDEIQVLTAGGWHDQLDLWVRILSIQTDPELMKETLTVTRVEKVQ